MMPTYNQLAASSLLSQQYNAALGFGNVLVIFFLHSFMLSIVGPLPDVSFPVLAPSGLHGIPPRRVPMVEQAVQTAPLAHAAQRKGAALTQPQGRQPVHPAQRSARGISQVQKENIPTSMLTQQWFILSKTICHSFSFVFLIIQKNQTLYRC